MYNFSDFGIQAKPTGFTGEKIKLERIYNVPIIVHDYKIEPSKKKENTKLLTLQIEKDNNRHIVFTGSTMLMQVIQQIDKQKFPFKTTIIKKGEYPEFT